MEPCLFWRTGQCFCTNIKALPIWARLKRFVMSSMVQQKELETGPVLVLAPHADDEMIGCGGWLILSRNRTVKRVVVFCTKRDAVRRVESEAMRVGLHIDSIIDLNLQERASLPAYIEVADKLSELLRILEPAIVFVPNRDDLHPDHRLIQVSLSTALIDCSELNRSMVIAQYEGFIPLGNANWWLDISKAMPEKQQWLRSYHSQAIRYGLVDAITHLNAYRGQTLFLRKVTYAEAYRRLSIDEYIACQAGYVP
jgi:LmbE family N-acetylglucosaminyl deacetylase